MHAISGILFNHESERRGLEFVTRKITWHAAAIKLGLLSELHLGNLDAERDWGYAKDYVEAMWRMLQRDQPEDYVIATGIAHSVRDCLEIAFDQAGLKIDEHVAIDGSLRRPAEVDHLIGDASKARRDLGWAPETSFEQMIRLMVDADHRLLQHG
jgi:GDPmannose 4,6-dehydratase